MAPAGRPRHEPPSPCLERRYPESSGAGGVRAGVIGQRRHSELSDQTLELGQPLAEGGVLRLEPSDRGRGIDRARLPPAGDAAARGADPPGAPARDGGPADLTQMGRGRRTYVTHRTRWGGDGGRVSLGRWGAQRGVHAPEPAPSSPRPNRPANCGHALARRRRTVLAHARWGPRQTRRSEGLLDCLSAALRPRVFPAWYDGNVHWNLKRRLKCLTCGVVIGPLLSASVPFLPQWCWHCGSTTQIVEEVLLPPEPDHGNEEATGPVDLRFDSPGILATSSGPMPTGGSSDAMVSLFAHWQRTRRAHLTVTSSGFSPTGPILPTGPALPGS